MDTTLVDETPAVLVNDRAARLMDTAVVRLGSDGGGDDPEVRLSVVGGLLAGSTWRSYRAGRVRLIGLVGSYWRWFRPVDAVFVASVRVPVAWQTSAGVFGEVFVCDADPDDADLAGYAARIAAEAAAVCDEFVGVRVVVMPEPRRSLFVPVSGTPIALRQSEWFFGHEKGSV